MLGRFIEGQQYQPPADMEEYARNMVAAFDSCVDFLRDPNRFPNTDINEITTLMWRLVGNKDIPAVLDQWGVPSIAFAVLGSGIEQMPIIILPRDFIQQIQEDPIFQLGVTSYMASQCRDYYSLQITGDNSDQINMRAQAFEAEALRTLQQMMQLEGIIYPFTEQQQHYLAAFPQGIKSLPSGMNYPTPEYKINPPNKNN